jgi:hypothetical protein
LRRSLAILAGLGALALTGAAHAAGGGKDSKAKEESADRQMVAPNVVTPVVRDGKLVNYLFVTIRVDFAKKASASKLRDRAHFLRDALLKASHAHALGDAADETKLNTAAAMAAFGPAVKKVLGAENVASIHIDAVDSLKRR